MRVMFLWPGIYLGWGGLGNGFEQSSINHGLSYISAALKKEGRECFLVDMRSFKGWEFFEQTIKEQKFDVCLVGFHSVDNGTADKAVRIIKGVFPSKPIIVGGVHITFNQIKEFSVADTVIWGEGDEIVEKLLTEWEKGKELPKFVIAERVRDLDLLEMVDRNLFNSEYEKRNPFLPLLPEPFYTINFSRGCNYFCSFCLESKNLLWKGQESRSPEKCVEELHNLMIGTGEKIGSLMIHDDNFPAKKSWLEKFIKIWDKILPRIPWWCQMRADSICRNKELIGELARLGMTWCGIGIEGSQRMLDFYNKKETIDQMIEASHILHENQVNIFANYILGAPTETEDDIAQLSQVLEEIKPEHHSASIYTAYPGSMLYDFCIENKLFVGDGSKDSDYYSLIRYPYERRIVGIDYEFVRRKQSELGQIKGELKLYAPKKIVAFQPKTSELRPEFQVDTKVGKNKTPKVSIVILSHDRPEFLSEAIDSILAQTMEQWELIIIDDYSVERDVSSVLEKAVRDPRIQAFVTNYDVDNISLLWNMAVDRAIGEYVAFLDDDNQKLPDFCKEMSEYLDEHQEFDAVACYAAIYANGRSLAGLPSSIFDSPKNTTKEGILKGNTIDSGCLMVRRSVFSRIGWFDERLKTEEDWDFVIRLMHESKGIGILKKPLTKYRWHKENRQYRAKNLGFDIGHKLIPRERSMGVV